MQPLDKESEEYKRLVTYVNNTHAPTHTQYKVEVEDIFEIKRAGEAARYKPFKKLPNRRLLWHGSRRTNWAGIISQGLRIAPPEAPVTGYMFGKGVYFADMVTKSANYCFTNPANNKVSPAPCSLFSLVVMTTFILFESDAIICDVCLRWKR